MWVARVKVSILCGWLYLFLYSPLSAHTPFDNQEVSTQTGINKLKSKDLSKGIDEKAADVLKQFSHLNIAIVKNGEIVLTKAYGDGHLNSVYAYASVSKPVTAMIIMQLVTEGKVKSIDDEIWLYSDKYKNCMPEEYMGASLTIRHLLTHTSGIPHIDEPSWRDGKLNLKFKPGTAYKYSTPGFGVLGDIIESVTGISFERALTRYIAKPVRASSFSTFDSFITPGAFIHSSIKDLALFSIGVIEGFYVKDSILYEQVFKPFKNNYGLGWACKNVECEDITVSHSGSNGAPKAYLLIKPRKKIAFCLLATQENFGGKSMLREFLSYIFSILKDLEK
jgi:CubicO group peptidase (beta-lactamase class C family)